MRERGSTMVHDLDYQHCHGCNTCVRCKGPRAGLSSLLQPPHGVLCRLRQPAAPHPTSSSLSRAALSSLLQGRLLQTDVLMHKGLLLPPQRALSHSVTAGLVSMQT